MHYSVATIRDPEFLNLRPSEYSPLISKCQIKVLYLGENRNHTSISKDAAMQLAKSLRGSPIVGHFREDVKDFGDHGEKIVIENNEIYFSCTTQPYGFVDLNAQIWFQYFNEIDENGNSVEREYLVTEGLLWTGQYPELGCLFECGRPQSMELDGESLQGSWAKSSKDDLEIFIINDGIFSKLCILGEDVEPCFEGSSVQVIESFEKAQTSYSYTESFSKTLYSMLQDLQIGGQKKVSDEEKVVNTEFTETEDSTTSFQQEYSSVNDVPTIITTDFAEAKKEDTKSEEEEKQSEEINTKENSKDEDKEEEKDKKFQELTEQFNLLNSNFQDLTDKYQALQIELQSLKCFKQQIDNREKEEMIKSFTTLSEEDKAEVVKQKDILSLEEIESKLSILYARQQKQIESMSHNDNDTKNFKMTYSIPAEEYPTLGWEQAVKQNRKNRGV